ncbi:heme lyase CcmF/NrfE family subunit [Pelagibacteraceae bacterium]|nr:heme lyase CcmF/NrfE family subunit [Pelagibacteraceae bacterium]MDC0937546.1 heme lyase CcmF/NrfE family subunit [Pelagibacteraceae bacterium]
MLSNFGNLLLFFNIFLSFVIIYTGYKSLRTSGSVIPRIIYQVSTIQSTLIVVCFFTLIAGFIISDFSLITVYQNSHSLKPLFYKITGTWGNHEGSLLLWAIILTIFSFLFLVFNKDHPKTFRVITLIIQNILIVGFLFFIVFNSNPFSVLSPIPREGLGLNPILQDPALAIHPPLLYIGFVGSSIYFSAAMASLITNYSQKPFVHSIKNWVLISWCFQSLGILVGSIWAYYELGWGGFWFWDPVENASLLPWFAMTALFHSLIVFEKRGLFYFWVIILCLLTFILSVTGTFLVRSGVLNSVHTFASDPARGVYILLFLSLMIFASIFLLFKKYKSENYNLNANSKETFILVNNWFMMFYLITVILGTIYPIFTDALTENKISVGPPFYNTVILPIVVIFLFFMAIETKVKWIKSHFDNIKIYLLILAGSIIINFLISFLLKSYSILSNLIIISAFFLIISSLRDTIKLFRKKTINLSQTISHTAFGFLVLFIGLNHIFSIEKDYNIKIGETKNFDNYSIKFQNLKLENYSNYKAIIGELIIKDIKTEEKNILKPEIRIYNNPQTITYEASIRTSILKDYYLTMSNIDRSDYYNIKFQKKPLMIWIWICVIMITVGGFLRLFKNAKNS